MSYRCAVIGVPGYGDEWHEPRIICDSCGAKVTVYKNGHIAPKWFLDDKPYPNWERVNRDGEKLDYCPKCKENQ